MATIINIALTLSINSLFSNVTIKFIGKINSNFMIEKADKPTMKDITPNPNLVNILSLVFVDNSSLIFFLLYITPK